MHRVCTTLGLAAASFFWPCASPARETPRTIDDYNVIWTAPSGNSSESMPCGGGDVGLNVWVEGGDLLIYLSRSGTFDELNGMPKLGRLRVTLSPNPFGTGGKFRQELKLAEGHVEIHGENDGLEAGICVWVDAFRPVVHIEIESNRPSAVTAAYESWRLTERDQQPGEMGANRSYRDAPEKTIVRPDRVGFAGDAVRFVHRNEGRTAFDLVVAQQELDAVKERLWNPLGNLTFGGSFAGRNFVAAGTREGRYASTVFRAWLLQSRRAARTHSLRAVLHVATAARLADWETGLGKIEEDADRTATEARRRTQAWWTQFWARSHIFINPGHPDPSSPVWQSGRNYQVFRYQLGCNASGAYPTKFNGGLFTFDPEFVDANLAYSPDFRNWGGGSFTAQNQRLLCWPLLKSGDFDLMKPQFDFYLRALGNAEARSQVYWDLTGASFTEQIENFGLPVAFEYNWHRNPAVERGIQDNAWVNHQWDTAFEFCQMILDWRRFTGADIRDYLPLIESCLRFHDEFYQLKARQRTGRPLADDGKLILFPGTACETYKDALNASSTLAALKSVLTSVAALPDSQLSMDRREHWRTMLARIPDLAFRDREGHSTIAPAWQWSHIQNVELPQLYPVYPWREYGVGRPGLEIAVNTWKYGADRPEQKQIVSWHQDAIFCACLGLTAEAAALTVDKLKDSGRRFPTWWGPGHDWVPDHNWGGSGMIGLQEMLLQTVDEKIYLLPAWPRDWDVDFKLRAPGNTIVEVVFAGGRFKSLRVTPASRAKDIVLPSF